MKRILLAWLVFFGGFLVEIAIDYALRMADGNIRTGGIPEPGWFLVQWVLAVVALGLLYTGTNDIRPLYRRLLSVSIHAAIAFAAYLVIGFCYVVGAGVDSL